MTNGPVYAMTAAAVLLLAGICLPPQVRPPAGRGLTEAQKFSYANEAEQLAAKREGRPARPIPP